MIAILKKYFRRFIRVIISISPGIIGNLFIRLPFSRFHKLHNIFLYLVSGEEIIELNKTKFNLNPGNFFDYFVYFFPINNNIEISTLLKYVKDSKCFVDIGANSGLFSLILTNENTNLETHAFEPNPEILNKFSANLKLNPGISDRVKIIKKAVSEKSGIIEFATQKEDIQSARIVSNYSGDKVVVDSISLDDYFENKNQFPDLIKMDAEGEELNILRGMKRILKNSPPKTLLIEIHAAYYSILEGMKFKQDILKIILDNNYNVFGLIDNSWVNVPPPEEWPGRFHLLLIQ